MDFHDGTHFLPPRWNRRGEPPDGALPGFFADLM